jgi:tRNA pseudouridine13 synthase
LSAGEALPFPHPPGYDARPWPPVIDRARLRSSPEDFRVDEVLGFEPAGRGEHRLLHVEKRGCNTGWVAERLARQLGIRPVDVGYAGLKDRHAVTRQWFSVPARAPGALDASTLEADGITVIEEAAHDRKLRRGAHRANQFRLVLRDVAGDRAEVGARLEYIRAHGVPNVFGPQRFGREGRNLELARAAAGGRRLGRRDRGFALSAARSLLFNAVLARRVAEGTWDRLLPGDRAALAGSRSHFAVDRVDDALEARLVDHDVHPSGPLWGRGEPPSTGAVRNLEQAVAAEHGALCTWLEAAGTNQERRPLRLSVASLQWDFDRDELLLSFRLTAGGFATAVLAALA